MQIDRSRVGLEDHFAAWQRARVLSFESIKREVSHPEKSLRTIRIRFQRGFPGDAAAALPWHVLCIHRTHDRDRSGLPARLSLPPALQPPLPHRGRSPSIYRNRCGKPKSTEMYSTYAWIESVVLHARPLTCSINSVCDLRSKTRVGNRIAYLSNLPPRRSSWKPFEISDRLDFHESSIRCLSAML